MAVIEIPKGYVLDLENSTEDNIVLKKENTLPTTWKEYCDEHPIECTEWLIDLNSETHAAKMGERHPKCDRNLFTSKEMAEAFLALMQLIRLRDCYRQGWKPNWTTDAKAKFTIDLKQGAFLKRIYLYDASIFSFPTAELKDKFYENFKDLIDKTKPIYK